MAATHLAAAVTGKSHGQQIFPTKSVLYSSTRLMKKKRYFGKEFSLVVHFPTALANKGDGGRPIRLYVASAVRTIESEPSSKRGSTTTTNGGKGKKSIGRPSGHGKIPAADSWVCRLLLQAPCRASQNAHANAKMMLRTVRNAVCKAEPRPLVMVRSHRCTAAAVITFSLCMCVWE